MRTNEEKASDENQLLSSSGQEIKNGRLVHSAIFNLNETPLSGIDGKGFDAIAQAAPCISCTAERILLVSGAHNS